MIIKRRNERNVSVRTHGDVIEPVKVRKGLRISLVLDELFRSTVQKTDVLRTIR